MFVNSPGGTTTGGEALFEALREVSKKKPVVAQFGTVAASAGYIVGLGTDHIVARGNTITGSVGVHHSSGPRLARLLDKLGVKFNEIKSGDLKAVPSPFEPLSEEGQKVTQADGRRGLPLVPRPRRAAPRHQDRPDVPGLSRAASSPAARRSQLKLVDSDRRRGRGGRVAEDEAQHRQEPQGRRLEAAELDIDWGFFSSHRRCGSELFGNHDLRRPNAGPRPALGQLGLDGLVSVWHPSEK